MIRTSRTFQEEQMKLEKSIQIKVEQATEVEMIQSLTTDKQTDFSHCRKELLQVTWSDSSCQLHAEHCACIPFLRSEIINRLSVSKTQNKQAMYDYNQQRISLGKTSLSWVK